VAVRNVSVHQNPKPLFICLILCCLRSVAHLDSALLVGQRLFDTIWQESRPSRAVTVLHQSCTNADLTRRMYMNISEPLPNELIDNIIDHLHGDQPSQQACALVSRTFLTSCRHHLYGRITLCPWERKWDPDFRKGTLMSFFHIAPYITSLTIDWEDGESSYPGDCGVVFDILPVISTHRGVPTLVSLRSLTHSALRLRDGRSKTSSTFIPTLLGSTGTTVKELNFESCTLPSIHIFAGVVASCTALEKLTLRHIAWDLVDSSGSSPLPKLPYQLHTFGYHGFYNSHSSILYQWISSQEPHLVIDPLSLYIGLSELPVISSLIANWGVLLKTLKLDFCWSNPGFGRSIHDPLD